MAHPSSWLPFLFILLLVSSTIFTTKVTSTSTVAKLDDQVPCTMCADCENPCQPLPPPPVVEYPPPPSLPPPLPPSPPPPSPPPPPVIVEICPPPPPKLSCPDNCETPPMPWTQPQGPPRSPYYYDPYHVPPGYDDNNVGKIMMPLPSFIFVVFLCLPYYYLFI